TADGETQESATVTLPADNSSALPRVTFQTPEKPGEESSHRKLGKLTIKYNRKDLQRWLDLEEWINAQLQELYQCRVICLLCLTGNSFSSSGFIRYLIATCYSTSLTAASAVRGACTDMIQLALNCLVLHLLGCVAIAQHK
uniref:Protein phosphatase 1 regulatory inhibitor subunit 14D n=1 Tax=Athene cunicularia TaxID=194338 RepID=A0A663LQ45_ATHCN